MNDGRVRKRRTRREARRERTAYRPFGNKEWRNTIQSSIEIPVLARLLRVPTGLRMLEIGCGRGVGLVALAAVCEPEFLVGVDVDGNLLDVARRRLVVRSVDAELVQLVNGDAQQLPFADGSFDVVVDFGTSYHLPRPQVALDEIVRVLDGGGLFVHETRISQLLAHPVRSIGNRLPWEDVPEFTLHRHAGLWACRTKRDVGESSIAA